MATDLQQLISQVDEGLKIDAFSLPLQQILIKGIEDSNESIAIADARHPDTPLVYVNKAFSRITDYAEDEVIGKNCRFLQGEHTDRKKVAQIRSAIEKQQPIVVELLNYRKGGTPFYNRLSLVPIFDDNKELTHYLAIQSDITIEKALTREKERTKAMKRTMEAVNDITGNLLNHMMLIHDQLIHQSGIEEELLADMNLSLQQAKERLNKINAMKGYSEKRYGDSFFIIDYEGDEEENPD